MSDREQIRELLLHIDNEPQLYPRLKSISAMFDKKVRQGKYDDHLAPKAYEGLVADAAALYYASPKQLHKITAAERKAALMSFSKGNRLEVAKALAKAYEADARLRGLTIDADRHLCHACAQHEAHDLGKHAAHEGAKDYHAAMRGEDKGTMRIGQRVMYTSLSGRDEELAEIVKILPRNNFEIQFPDGTRRDAPLDRLRKIR